MACRSIQAVGKSFALLFSPIFCADCNLERILLDTFWVLRNFFSSQFEANFGCQQKFFHCFLILKPLSKKWKYYFRLSLKKSWTFPEFSPPFICSLEMKLARSKNFFLLQFRLFSFIANLIGMFDVFWKMFVELTLVN